jgi:arabinogalactan oligomer/maltooligosaccharide transport system permease protein
VNRRRLWFGVGLALAALVAVLLVSGVRRRAGRVHAALVEERQAIVSLNALSTVVSAAGGSGEALRAAVAAWAKAHPSVTAVRVVRFEGISLEASTAREDSGDRAAPRRLAREEKALYDRGQRLRAAVETNRQEGAPRKQEIEVERLAGGGLSLAAPVETDGEVVGMTEIRTVPAPVRVTSIALSALLGFAAPVLLFAAAAAFIGERRWARAVASLALLLGSLLFLGWRAGREVGAQRKGAEEAVAQRAADEARLASGALARTGAAAKLSPGAWDTDAFRRARGRLDASGRPDPRRLATEVAAGERDARRAVLAVGVLALAVWGFFGFGLAALLGTTVRRHRVAYFYILPAMLGMLAFVLFPFAYGITLSFTDQTIYTTGKPLSEIWVGLKNYGDILGDFSIAKRTAEGSLVFNYQNFYWTLLFTVGWTISNVTIGVTVGLVLALILNTAGLALRPVYRVLLILPWAVPNYITALIWRGMFHQQFGVINQVLQMFGLPAVSWFERPFTSFLTALSTNGWLSFPFMMVISLGALQSIPAEIYEAARVEGATRWQQFKSITLPSLKPALIPAIILSVVWTFNMFNIIYLVTAGEPASSTEILITQAYKFAFERYRYGYAAAYSTIIFLILLVYGVIQNRATRATEAI